jgi:hypothetical protein
MIEEIFANATDGIRRAIRQGRLKQAPNERQHPHGRMYTKAYADRRQVKGHGLYQLMQKRLDGTNPHPTRREPVPSMQARYRAFLAQKSALQRGFVLAGLKRGETLRIVDRYGTFRVGDRQANNHG